MNAHSTFTMIRSVTVFLALISLSSHTIPSAAGQTIINIAGTGIPGYSGDGGPAIRAQLNNPYGLVRGPDDALYICDIGNHVVRRISPSGIISTVAGSGQVGYSGDGGPASEAKLNEPYEIRFDSAGNMFFVEMRNHLIRKVNMETGVISTVAGTGKAGFSGDDGPALQAQFRQPHSIQFGPDGHLYICDIGNHRIRKIDMKTGVIQTIAGTGERKPTPDGAPLEGTPLNGPRAIDFDSQKNLWIALREGNAIYKADMNTRTLHHVAGTGQKGFTGNDGPAANATLSGPKGISVGPNSDVYFADTESHSIRAISSVTRKLHLVAGTGERGDGPEGDPLACRLARPHGIYVDADNRILIGDSEAHRVRCILPDGKEAPFQNQ